MSSDRSPSAAGLLVVSLIAVVVFLLAAMAGIWTINPGTQPCCGGGRGDRWDVQMESADADVELTSACPGSGGRSAAAPDSDCGPVEAKAFTTMIRVMVSHGSGSSTVDGRLHLYLRYSTPAPGMRCRVLSKAGPSWPVDTAVQLPTAVTASPPSSSDLTVPLAMVIPASGSAVTTILLKTTPKAPIRSDCAGLILVDWFAEALLSFDTASASGTLLMRGSKS